MTPQHDTATHATDLRDNFTLASSPFRLLITASSALTATVSCIGTVRLTSEKGDKMAEANWEGSEVSDPDLFPHKQTIENGRFKNPWDTWKDPTPKNTLKWSLTEKNDTNLPNSKDELNEKLPVEKWDPDKIRIPPKDGTMRVTWIGHATVLVQMEGLNILTDPIFSKRCAPFQLVGSASTKRFRGPPCTVADLPDIHVVLISHNHYDHLDYDSVVELNKRFSESIHWFVPQKLGSWFTSSGCAKDKVHELDWWTDFELDGLTFAFTPAQHWSTRNLIDKNKTLWGSWCVIGQRQRFYFAGDTGYCTVFEVIGRKYGPFDLAAIPIGAYQPRWFMKHQHVDPEQAVQIHQDIKAKKSVGIHWGTFALANEHYLEPPEKLATALKEKGLSKDEFFVLNHGGSREIPS